MSLPRDISHAIFARFSNVHHRDKCLDSKLILRLLKGSNCGNMKARTVVFLETINENEDFYSPMYIYKLILESGLYMIHIRRSNLDVRFLILEMKTKCKTNLNI